MLAPNSIHGVHKGFDRTNHLCPLFVIRKLQGLLDLQCEARGTSCSAGLQERNVLGAEMGTNNPNVASGD
jgi:hypothetical protein